MTEPWTFFGVTFGDPWFLALLPLVFFIGAWERKRGAPAVDGGSERAAERAGFVGHAAQARRGGAAVQYPSG